MEKIHKKLFFAVWKKLTKNSFSHFLKILKVQAQDTRE